MSCKRYGLGEFPMLIGMNWVSGFEVQRAVLCFGLKKGSGVKCFPDMQVRKYKGEWIAIQATRLG